MCCTLRIFALEQGRLSGISWLSGAEERIKHGAGSGDGGEDTEYAAHALRLEVHDKVPVQTRARVAYMLFVWLTSLGYAATGVWDFIAMH